MRLSNFLAVLLVLSTSTAGASEPPIPRFQPAWSVRSAVEPAVDNVHACYVRHVPADSRVGNGDNARVRFIFAPDGNVTSATLVDTTVAQKNARDCIVAALKNLRAPIASERPTDVVVWLGLSSKRDEMTLKLEADPNQQLSSTKVVEIARANMDAYMKCYTDRLDSKPELAGTVKFEITVGRRGKVTSTRVLQSLDSEVDQCIVKRLSELTFPAPGDNAPVIATLPITFRTK